MTQTGDRELVIGNKQLISLFFVVVALCGVFFAMGYMIGRNSGKTTLGDANPPAVSGGPRPQSDEPRQTASAAPPGSATSASEQPTPAPGDAKVETKPAQDVGGQSAAPPPDNQQPYRAETKPVDTAKAATGSSSVSVPEAGASYLQVTALGRADADGVVKTLREQNFPTILAASSKDGLFRVLVGPYHQTSQLADAKARLKTIGFGGAFVQKQP